MWLFDRGKKEPLKTGKGEIPVQKVNEMFKYGLSERDVIETLRKEGYSAPEVSEALNRVIKTGVEAKPASRETPSDMTIFPEEPTIPEGVNPAMQSPIPASAFGVGEAPVMETEQPEERWPEELPEFPEMPMSISGAPTHEEIEEVVEVLVEEKWNELVRRLESIERRFANMDAKFREIDLQLASFKESGMGGQETLEGKIDEQKENFSNIEARLGSIEKAFKETLPSMIESVRTISEITERLKKEG